VNAPELSGMQPDRQSAANAAVAGNSARPVPKNLLIDTPFAVESRSPLP